MLRAAKISIQGVQPKLSAILNIKIAGFELADAKGKFILKPQTDFPQLPENEDLTMHLAEVAGFEVPLHGLIYTKDQSLVYFIQRFDREGRSGKVHTEDFAQLAGLTRQTKYNFSMERLIGLLDQFCTFPQVEKAELFRRVLFNYLIGNEDMHLKNYSIIIRDGVTLRNPEEIALPLNSKKRGLTRVLLIKYLGKERLDLEDKIIDQELQKFSSILPAWFAWIEKSFLTKELKEKYTNVVVTRARLLQIIPS